MGWRRAVEDSADLNASNWLMTSVSLLGVGWLTVCWGLEVIPGKRGREGSSCRILVRFEPPIIPYELAESMSASQGSHEEISTEHDSKERKKSEDGRREVSRNFSWVLLTSW
jgi:hypothetical protein